VLQTTRTGTPEVLMLALPVMLQTGGMNKICTKCRVEQPLAAFARDAKRRDGLQPWCRGCIGVWRAANRDRLLVAKKADYRANSDHYKALGREWRIANAEHKKQQDREWRERNPDRKAANDRAWYEANKDRKIAYDAVWAPAYRAANLPRAATRAAKRRAMKFAAMPAWVNQAELKAVYDQCGKMRRETGLPYEVDHIVPLDSEVVCGLHVPWNLRIILGPENRAKSNRLIEEEVVVVGD
jgi:5-methylcytosine-specific restriction endonuclease McrA